MVYYVLRSLEIATGFYFLPVESNSSFKNVSEYIPITYLRFCRAVLACEDCTANILYAFSDRTRASCPTHLVLPHLINLVLS